MIRRPHLLILSTVFSLFCGVSLADNTPQVVRTDIYRLARQGDSLLVDMNINLAPIRLAPDCSMFLLPTLYNGSDSLNLAPVLLNGPQSDRMYRRRKALGWETAIEKVTPYLILREGEHTLPRINYQTAVPYQAWMDSADVKLSKINCNCDDRISRFDMRTVRVAALVRTVVEKETVRDTIYITKTVERAPFSSAFPQAAVPQEAPKGWRSGAYTVEVSEESKEITIYFDQGSGVIGEGYSKDRQILAAMDTLMLVAGNEKKLSVLGYTSPEGSYASNQQLAVKRVTALKAFLENRFGSNDVSVTTQTFPEGWELLTQLVGDSQLMGKDAVLETIRQTNDFQKREWLLKTLNSGVTYKRLLTEFFPKLRKVVIKVN